MCFSAGASFVAAGGLGALGVASLRTASKKEKIIAAVPFLFGAQQLFEGLQWTSVSCGNANPFATYGFLFFALLLWPIYVPLVVFIIDKKIGKVSELFLALGVVVALFYAITLFFNGPPGITVMGRSLRYDINPPLNVLFVTLYFVATCGALMVSKRPGFRWFGGALLTSASLAELFFFEAFISVWCFFAALLSITIYFYLRRGDRKLLG